MNQSFLRLVKNEVAKSNADRKVNESQLDIGSIDCSKKLTVDVKQLKEILSLGEQSAREVGSNAGAVFICGRRVLYYMPKVVDYIAKMCTTREAEQ